MDPQSSFRHLVTRAALIAALLLFAFMVRETVWKRPRSGTPTPASTALRPKDPRISPPAASLPGEMILKGYAQPGTRPEDDLGSMAHAFSNLTLLVKGDSPFRMGANEEFAAALRGKNRDQLRFLPDTHPCFNAVGQIIDRWGTPLFFHVKDKSRIDMRSAGPDRRMWTDDDLHRRHDGQFHRGKVLPAQR
jgi:hypothetical protein